MKTRRYRLTVGFVLSAFMAYMGSKAAQTNQMAVRIVPQDFVLEEPGLSTDTLTRWGQELVRNDDALNDKLSFQSYHKWAGQFDWNGYSIHEEVNNTGAKAIARLMSDSAVETALGVLPIEEIKESGLLLGDTIWDGVFGTLGNTVEERSSEDSLSLQESRQSWIGKLGESKSIFYGVKPFRTTPYAYFGTRLGHHGDSDLPIMIWEVRYRYRLMHGNQLWTSLSFPLGENFRVAASLSADFFENSNNEKDIVSSFRFEHVLGRGRDLHAIYVGVRNDAEKTYASVGYFVPF